MSTNTMRLDKFLSNMGAGSRKAVRTYFKAGAVSVDGEIVTDWETKIDTDKNEVKIYETVIKYQKYIYLMMNKPAGVISATSDSDEAERTVVDLLPEDFSFFDPFPVGRLDRDTVGLLILSNDGIFSHRTLSPKKHVEKEYFAKAEGEIGEHEIEMFEKGVTLDDGYLCKPAKLEIVDNGYKITVVEGKFHQIKRMFEAVGAKVVFLKRMKFAGIELDESLEEGGCRELNSEEMSLIDKFISKD